MLQPSSPGRIVGRDSCPGEVGSSSLSEVDLVVILRLTRVDFAAVRQMTACLEKLQLRFDAILEPVDNSSQRERHNSIGPYSGYRGSNTTNFHSLFTAQSKRPPER